LLECRLGRRVEIDWSDGLHSVGLGELDEVGIATELDSDTGEEIFRVFFGHLPLCPTTLEVMVQFLVRRRKPALEMAAAGKFNNVRLSRNR
jgi:hypothetical protein